MPTAHLRDVEPIQDGQDVTSQNPPSNEREKQEAGRRRVTGSIDIGLNEDGRKQARELASKLSQRFTLILCSPKRRAIQTAKFFGTPMILGGLDAWRRGELEGQPVDAVKDDIRSLMNNPDRRPEGESPESEEPGESLNEFARPLIGTFQAILAMLHPDDRVLAVSHGGNLQTLDAWLRAGKPDDLTFDHKEMSSKPYWSVTGKLFRVGDKELEQVEDNQEPALYVIEHSATSHNPITTTRPAESGASDERGNRASQSQNGTEPRSKGQTPTEENR